MFQNKDRAKALQDQLTVFLVLMLSGKSKMAVMTSSKVLAGQEDKPVNPWFWPARTMTSGMSLSGSKVWHL